MAATNTRREHSLTPSDEDEPQTAAELAHDLSALVALGLIALEPDDDGELRVRVRASATGTAP